MTEIKLALLLSFGFLFLVLIVLMVILKTIGAMNHSLNRLEEVISKEVILTYNTKVNELRSNKQKQSAAVDRKRRQEALLNVPLVENPDQ